VPKKKILLFLLVLWLVFVTTLSLISLNSFSKVQIKGGDKYVHFIFYFVLTGLLILNLMSKFNFRKAVFISAISSVIYGIIIEVLQGVVTAYREPEILDILFNSLGCIFAAFLMIKNQKRLNFIK
jgi:VanZ family protein